MDESKVEELLKDFFNIGIKQGAFEKRAKLSAGKISEIYRGRTLITPKVIDDIIEGMKNLRQDIDNIIEQLEAVQDAGISQSYLVYEFIFPNGKKYYGMTYNTEARWQNGRGYKTQKVGKAIEEFGWDNIEKNIIVENITKEKAKMIERCLIQNFGTYIDLLGYNDNF